MDSPEGEGYSKAGLTLGIIAVCVSWVAFLPLGGFRLFTIWPPLILSILATVFGFLGYYKGKSGRGLAGGILGVIGIMLTIVFLMLSTSMAQM